MAFWNPHAVFRVAPDALEMPPGITARLREQGVTVEETTDLEAAMAEANVLYMTRIQKERFDDPSEYERLAGSYVLTREMVERINPGLTIMHPLPRVDEIPPELEAALEKVPGALNAYRAARTSQKKQWIYWLQTAKRDETRERRIQKIIEALKGE